MDSENNPGERQGDTNLIFRVWGKIYPYWHIGATVSGFLLAFSLAVWWIRDVSAYADVINDHDKRIERLETNITDIAEIKGEVSTIRQFLGAPAPKTKEVRK